MGRGPSGVRRRWFLAVASVAICAVAASALLVHALGEQVVTQQPSAAIATASPSEGPSASPSAAPWNLDDDVGSIMVLSWKATTPWPVVSAELVHDRIGGVLLFAANFGGTQQGLATADAQLRALASTSCANHPILTMLDQEGGDVVNVHGAFAPPWPEAMAAAGADQVRALEQASGAGLSAAGLGLDLAPVADVRTNPGDLVIGARSFGSNPAQVAPLVAAAVQGLHDGGVGATIKHFPGLGGAAGDPHVAIPTDPETEARWEAVQLPAFRAGIAAGADAVMVTAVYVPGLGAGNVPAMFSPAVVGRIRSQLGFNGVIMSDSLSMGGLDPKWPLPVAAVAALAAGNDMLLLGNGDPAYEALAVATVKAAVLSGRLSRAQIHASAMRVNALRERRGQRPSPCHGTAGAG
jgi:beta-N-acetylhexosaminidase